MTRINLEEMKARIADRCDPDEVVDVLGLTTLEILDKFEDRLQEKIDEWEGLDNPE